jgi:hypothetical protein
MTRDGAGDCLVGMSLPVSPQEIRAAAETYQELGPGYRDAVIESFLDRVGQQIDARVDVRVAQHELQAPGRLPRGAPGSPMALAIASMVLGIPISGIAVAAGTHPAGLMGLIVVWTAIAVINVAYTVSLGRPRPPLDRR